MKQFLSLILFFAVQLAYGQANDTTATDPYEMSLEQLMNIKVSASKTNLSSRETPSIVSVITREDIKNMGARDLMDVLNQVPGFSFGCDVQGIVGVGSRGNWGHEGKILLLIDGNEMNEILYATTQFGQHYDISNIDRIEIIRGPGSSIYGGYAELGVINIITRNGQQMKEASAGVRYGNTDGATSRQNFRLHIGNGNEKVNYSLTGLIGNGIRSTQYYYDFPGAYTDMKQTSKINQMMFNGGLNAGQFSMSMIYDGYSLNNADQLGTVSYLPSGETDKVRFNNFYTSLKYNLNVGSKVTITPRINFKTGTPWKTSAGSPVPYSVSASRFAPGVNANIKPNESVDILIGADSYFDFATAKDVAPDSIYFASINNSNKVSFHNIGVFAQGVFKTPFANFTLGARLDNHSQFGSAFSPRVGITKAWDNFHIKALYSRAFRAPAIENIHASATGSIKPELTGVAELEVGYKINDNMFVTANGFNIVITDPIVYFTQGNSQYYGNFNQSGSSGFEIDYRIKYSWGYLSANYSSYSAKNINKVPLYQDSTYHQNSVLSLPTGRFNLLANIKLGNIFSINPSINALSKRYTYLGKLSNNQSIYATINSQVIANLFIRAKVKNIDAGVGVYNITDEKQYFIQAYSGGHMPLPGLGREIVINFAYSIPFK